MILAEELRAPDVATRVGAIASAGGRDRLDPQELHALGACLGDPEKIVQRRAAEACAVLAERGVALRPLLGELLDSERFADRWGATYALSRLGAPPPESLPVLIEALGTDDGDLRWAAANVIGQLEDRDAVIAELLRVLPTGTTLQRKMALYCLRDVARPSPVLEDAALAALADPDPGVRLAAMSALARLAMDPDPVATRLLPLMDDSDAGVRRAAPAALARLGSRSPTVVQALERASQSDDPALRRSAVRALGLLV
jgi:HEAT repeat protein